MAKGDQQEVQKKTRENLDWTRQQSDMNRSILGGMYDMSQRTAQGLQPGLISGYGDIASKGLYDPSVLGTINKGYTGLAEGGFTPEAIGQMQRQATQGIG